MMKKLIVLFLVSLSILVACKTQEEKEKEQSKKGDLVMYEYSELALLMLKMHDEGMNWKAAIQNDSFAIEFPNDYFGIYTLEATDSTLRNAEFKELADAYISSVEDLITTKKNKKQIKKFNASVDACINCHAVFCQGPIDKIELLYIE